MAAEKCQQCGRFTSWTKLIHRLITPDSELTKEEWETICWKCDGRLDYSQLLLAQAREDEVNGRISDFNS